MSELMKKKKPDFLAHLKIYFDEDLDAFKTYMFSSAFKSYIYAALFLAASFIFNGEYILIPKVDDNAWWGVFGIIIRAILIDGFFVFALSSFGNIREMRGNPLGIFELCVVAVISLAQGYKYPIVIFVALYGIIMLLAIMHKRQVKTQESVDGEQKFVKWDNRKKQH